MESAGQEVREVYWANSDIMRHEELGIQGLDEGLG